MSHSSFTTVLYDRNASLLAFVPNICNNITQIMDAGMKIIVPNGSKPVTVSKRVRSEYCDTTYVIYNTKTKKYSTVNWSKKTEDGIQVTHSGDKNDFFHVLSGNLAEDEIVFVILVAYGAKPLVKQQDHNPSSMIYDDINGINYVVPLQMEEAVLGTDSTAACVMTITRISDDNLETFINRKNSWCSCCISRSY